MCRLKPGLRVCARMCVPGVGVRARAPGVCCARMCVPRVGVRARAPGVCARMCVPGVGVRNLLHNRGSTNPVAVAGYADLWRRVWQHRDIVAVLLGCPGQYLVALRTALECLL